MKIIKNIEKGNDDVIIYIMEKHGYAFCELSYYKNEKHNMFLSNLNVLKDQRHKKIATVFLKIIFKMAHKKGCHYLYLGVESASTNWVFNWYKRIGFIPYKISEDGITSMYKIL